MPRGDERQDLRPVGRPARPAPARGLAFLGLRTAGHLRQVLQQRLLRLRGVLLALQQAALVAQLLDLVLDALALGLQRLLVGAWDVAAARIDRLDVEAGRRLAVDADRAGHGLGGQIAEDERVLALVEREARGARGLRAGGKNRHALDARGDGNLSARAAPARAATTIPEIAMTLRIMTAHPSLVSTAFGGRWRPDEWGRFTSEL